MANTNSKSGAPKKGAAKKSAAKKGGAKKTGGAKLPSKGNGSKDSGTKDSGGTGAVKNNDFKAFKRGSSAPKDGQLVEFTDSVTKRGVYNAKEGVVYVNGQSFTPHHFRTIDPNSLSQREVSSLRSDFDKSRTFDDLDVPQNRRGENLHEQNPDLHADISRERIGRQIREGVAAQKNTNFGEEAEAEIDGNR